MTRADYLAFLTQAVKDALLTEDEARRLLASFDAGSLNENDFPLLPTLAIIGLAGFAIPSLTGSRDELQDEFHLAATRLARSLASGLPVAIWQEQMRELLISHAVAQAGAVNDALAANLVIEQAYLMRFADKVAVARMLGKPISDKAITAQAIGYAGLGRAESFKAQEAEAADGDVADYISIDSPSTCSACLDAETSGPYLPSSGPFPGQVCFGGGRCHCRRELRHAPAEAERLRAA